MARQCNGTNQALLSASAVNFSQATLLSIAFWLYWDAFANDDDIAIESASVATGTGSDMTFNFNPNSSSPPNTVVAVIIGNAGLNGVSFTRPSAAAWHHYVINIDVSQAVSEIPTIYVDGSSMTLTVGSSNNNTVGGFGSRVIHAMSRDGSSLFGAGRIAEIAFYTGINLSGTDATNLFNGSLPTSVQSGNLVNYWKLCGVDSPELATIGGINMTVTGATSVEHPIANSCGTPITGLRPAICL